jgi:hypothetical protein
VKSIFQKFNRARPAPAALAECESVRGIITK